jgi:hypothetical protein
MLITVSLYLEPDNVTMKFFRTVGGIGWLFFWLV